MTTFDKSLALVCARASAAAYELDDAKRQPALAAVGLAEQGYIVGRDDARALFCGHPTLGVILAFQGTQFTRGELESIGANLKADPVDIGDGRTVHAGYRDQLNALLDEIMRAPRPQIVTGHSMGGAIAHLFCNIQDWGELDLVSFGAPMCANVAFWQAAKNLPLRIVHERDFAPGFPEISSFTQPVPLWWLHDSKIEEVNSREGINWSIADHDIAGYISAIEALT